MIPYEQLTQELIGKGILSTDDIYYYSKDPHRELFDKYYNFCITNLLEEGDELGIEPARIYFNKDFSVNAFAGHLPPYNIIGINMGLIVNLYDFFSDKNEIFEQDNLSKYSELHKKLDVPLDHLLYQISTLFTYYHERAHLIQKSDESGFEFTESYFESKDKRPYSALHHIHEFDADLQGGAYFSALHLIDYWKRQNNELQTEENLQKIIAVGTSSIIIYFIFLSNGLKDIYYKEELHPHPLVRITYIIDFVTKVIEENLPNNISLSARSILRDAFLIAEAFYLFSGENKIEGFADIFRKENDNIEAYINELIKESHKYPNLVNNRVALFRR